jgi:hypothetical protein
MKLDNHLMDELERVATLRVKDMAQHLEGDPRTGSIITQYLDETNCKKLQSKTTPNAATDLRRWRSIISPGRLTYRINPN